MYDKIEQELTELDENLHKWFKEKWVRFGPDGKIRGDCAREKSSEGKPKCRPAKAAYSMGKKARATAARRKRREDPNPDRKGKAKNVKTEEIMNENHICPICQGELVSEVLMNEKKDACYYKVKSRYDVWPSAYASGALVKCRKKGAKNWGNKSEGFEEVDEACWKGYHKDGMKTMFGKKYPNCVKNTNEQEELDEKWSKKYKSSIDCSHPKGFSQKAHCQGRKKTEEEIMKENTLKNLIKEMVEEVMNEAMSGEEYAKDIQTSEGVFKYWMEEDREPDNMKLFFYVKGPDGKVHDVDMNPYEYNPYSPENIEKVKNWIESGMPKTKINETEGEDCPHCNNQGWYAVSDKYTGEPAQEQCEWCYTNPKSKFNVDKEDLEEYYESTKWDIIPEGDEHTCEGNEFYEMYGDMNADATLEEAEYRGRKVKLGKPMRGDVKKFKVFVKNPKTGNVKKVNFGDPNMRIKKSNPKRRKSFRARHKCSTAKDRTSARYWSCRAW